jgi:catechol 2,3-dioxygenase-like lactoylglutathione lyase family enzyme
MNILEKSPKYGLEARHRPQSNKFTLTGCDHFALPARDPEASGRFFEHVLGGVEFFRAGYEEEDRAKNKARHIFYHVGATLVELVEQRTERGYADYTNPDGENGNPHWAFGTTLDGLAAFAENLKREGVPFAGPRRHGKEISAVSVYFLDIDGNILEVTTWEQHAPDSFIIPAAPGERFIESAKLKHNWKPH